MSSKGCVEDTCVLFRVREESIKKRFGKDDAFVFAAGFERSDGTTAVILFQYALTKLFPRGW
jgi:hypothetical protein